jgi:beta-galactosidase
VLTLSAMRDRKIVAVVSSALTGALAPAAGAHHGATPQPSSDFDRGWKFALVNRTDITDPTGAYANAADPGYDDGPWRTVDLSHDWSIELDPTPEGTTSDTGYFQGGLGWYRKAFTLPRSAAHKSVSLEFDGVYMDSVVFLNGMQVASHPYGYTGFAVDLKDAHADGHTRNVVAVEVRNKLPSSRWYSGSGIYRNVHLVITDPVHVARHGTFVTTPDVESTYKQGFANVHVRTDVVGATADTSVVTRVQHARGRTVAGARPAAPQDATATSNLRLARPHLWSTDDPYLYTLTTEIRQGRRTVDRTTTSLGVRWFDFDPAQGFSLNGHSMKLQGVDLHHDEGALGAAVNKDALMRQMRTMKSMGVNAFRTSHNPPSPEMIEVCQELGIVMMVEAFDTWRTRPSASTTTAASSTPTATATSRRWSTPRRTRRPSCCGPPATRSPTRPRPPSACRSPSAWWPTSRRSTPRARSSSARTSTAASPTPARAPTSSSASSTAWG